MNGKKISVTFLSFGIILFCLTALFYLIKFSSLNFSNETKDWVDFANFFSGILNPILALLNLVFFAYLSFKIIKIEDERNNWTLQELARPFGNLNLENTLESLEICIHNVGLGPMILTDFKVFKNIDNPYKSFFNLVNDIADEESVSYDIPMKIDSFTLISDNGGAIAKDRSLCVFKLYFLDGEGKMDQNRNFIELMKTKLNEYSISLTYKDMYGREIECINEKISFDI